MHITRQMTTIFLFNGEQCLIMERSADRDFGPGYWAGVGGHLEPEELRNPQQACLREIEEETGFVAADIEDLHLKYIVLRLKANEIRQQYVYFARTQRRDFTDTSEGKLHWMHLPDLLDRYASKTTHFIVQHYLAEGKESDAVHVGTLFDKDKQAAISWTLLQDWED